MGDSTSDLLLAFVESGADIQADVLLSFLRGHFWYECYFRRSSYIFAVKSLDFHVSPLTIVKYLSAEIGDMLAVEQAFIARGAVEHATCTAITIARKESKSESEREESESEGSESEEIVCQVSAEQSELFVGVLPRYISARQVGSEAVGIFKNEIPYLAEEIYDQRERDRIRPDHSDSESSCADSFHSAASERLDGTDAEDGDNGSTISR